MIKYNFINNPNKKIKKISINYAGRSGSFFLHNLLEGHEKIITLQNEYDRYLYNLAKTFFLSNQDLDNYSCFLKKNLKDNINEHLKIYNSSTFFYDLDKICNEIEDIVSKIKHRVIEKNFDLLLDIFYISHCHLNQKYIDNKDHYILIQTHTPFNEKDYLFFINNLNIHTLFLMLRDPVKAIDSHFFHHSFESINHSPTLLLDLLSSFKESFLSIHLENSKKKVFVVSYENLHNETFLEIDRICKRLNIKVDDILFKETIGRNKLTKEFISNREIISGFRKVVVPESLKILKDYEIELIEILFEDIIQKFNYKFRSTKQLTYFKSVIKFIYYNFVKNLSFKHLMFCLIKIGVIRNTKYTIQ